ncbi:ATP-binding protein [Intrasporangium chromatireducens Q5-1]|uniref:ATP-binding protein n=1 Tax=Intrasporangium chromatireducens Q5-1 TaxID=584657 RepID=W9GSE5_9MICO|nr:ATP-binding protein [Intrasporangium chromatireducens]EWT06819.1 ATP-binding protein [Intrasporangium chromatireducens Q5-1]
MPRQRWLGTHAGASYGEPGQDRASRKQRLGEVKRLAAEGAQRAADEASAAQHAAGDLVRPDLLPPLGEHRPLALRPLRRLRLPAHRATTDVLSGAYPFLAEAGLGADGVFVGQDAWSGGGFVFDPWVLYQRGTLTNPNCLLAGAVGKGKSCLAKCLATRSIAFGRRVYVPGDPKGEWTAVAAAVGGNSIQLGGGSANRLNPLDPGPRDGTLDDSAWDVVVTTRRRTLLGSLAESALGRPLAAVEHTTLDVALRSVVDSDSVPTLPRIVNALFEPTRGEGGASVTELTRDGRDVGHGLRRLVSGDLAGLFDGPSTVAFDPTLPMVTLDLSRIQGSDQLTAMVMTCASAWMEAALASTDGGQRWVIYDEAWRLIRQPALLARMQGQWKLSRGLGIANLLIIHRLSDLDAVGDAKTASRAMAQGLLADCSTKIVYQQEASEAGHALRQLGLSVTEGAQLPDLQRGEGLWRVGQRAFIVRHLATDAELDLFDTSSRMVDRPGPQRA